MKNASFSCPRPHRAFVINDTPSSLSKSAEYENAIPAVLARMLAMEMPARLRRKVRAKLSAALYERPGYFQGGEIGKTWRHHAHSLNAPAALLRYSLFTRHIVLAPLK